MQLSKVKLSGDFRVTNTTGTVENWDYQIDLFKSGKAATTKAYNNLHFFSLLNGALFGANIAEDIAVSNVLVGQGDGTATNFTGTIGLRPVKPGSFSLTDGVQTIVDTDNGDGTGTLSGTTPGTIDYSTGAWDATFDAAPANGDNILLDWTRGISGDDTITAGFTFVLTTDTDASTGEGTWTNIVSLAVTPTIVDRFERANTYVYKVEMTAQYTGAATDAITGVGIAYQATEGTGGGVSASEFVVIKSIAPMNNEIYPSGGLVLSDTTDIKVTYFVTVDK